MKLFHLSIPDFFQIVRCLDTCPYCIHFLAFVKSVFSSERGPGRPSHPQFQAFLKRKNIVLSAKRYGIDALGAMAQGLFCSLLIGTIVKTLGEQTGRQ